jgi:hypothetical protein
MAFCKCGDEIHPKRIEILDKMGKAHTCLSCSTTQKVGGFMSTEGKTERTIIIAEMDTINTLHKLSARAGTGVSKGVKMSQVYSAKHNK